MHNNIKKNILITSGRSANALHMARQFQNAGHTIFTADTCRFNVCRFSNSVRRHFLIPSPKHDSQAFVKSVVKIAKEEKIDMIIPVYEEIIHLARKRHLFPKHCQILASSFDLLNELHNKWLFTKKVEQAGLKAPPTILIQSQDDLSKLNPTISYALKASYSRASLSIIKYCPQKDPKPQLIIEAHNSWIAQEWLQGQQFCSFGVCQNGSLRAHAVYPVEYTADKKGCIVFRAIDHTPILDWIKLFVKAVNFTGQIAFDFIETPDKELYAIECNPRSTHGVLLFDETDQLDQAFLTRETELISPKIGAKTQIGIAMLLYGWRKSAFPNNSIRHFLKNLLGSKDTIISRKDPMPFLAQPLIMSEIWMNGLKSNLSLPAIFMSDYEWNGK